MRRRIHSKMATEALLGRIAGGENLRAICRDEGMPSAWLVLRRLAVDEEFARRFELARVAQADAMFEELQAIADAEAGKGQAGHEERKGFLDKVREFFG